MRNKGFCLLITAFLALDLPLQTKAQCYREIFVDVHGQDGISNEEYPEYYPKWTDINCQFFISSPPNTKIVLQCPVVQIPYSVNCHQDRLGISPSGDPQFRDAKYYCDGISVTEQSVSNAMTVGLFAPAYSGFDGGRFYCSITAIQNPNVPTSPPAGGSSCDCGWQQKRKIVGGVETGVNEFPYVSALIDVEGKRVFCGSIIVSDRYAMTAAHCLVLTNIKTKALLVGDHDISKATETSTAVLHKIETTFVHHAYNKKTQENDIALVKTLKRIVYSLQVGPICMPYRYTYPQDNFNYTTVRALGWGTTEFTGPASDVLLTVNLTIIPNSRCQQELPNDVITDKHLCTYGGYQKDTCQFDSGGPLIWYDSYSRRYRILGIVSFGMGCGSKKPSVNTWVPSYLDWVTGIVTKDSTFCPK